MRVRTYVGSAGTLNLGDGPTATKLHGILAMIALHHVTLLGMQEGSDRAPLLKRLLTVLRHPAAAVRRLIAGRTERREIRKTLKRSRWRIYQPRVPGGKAVPIAYDATEWRLLRARTFLAVAREWVGAFGAGPTWAKPKVVARVVLRHRHTLEVVEHLNTHFLPSADRGNLPPREKAARVRHYGRHARKVARLVRNAVRRDHGVVVTMDANATRTSDLIEPMRDAQLVGWTTSGTHGARGIDHVLTYRQGLVVGSPAFTVLLHGFDHRAVVRRLYVLADPHSRPRSVADEALRSDGA